MTYTFQPRGVCSRAMSVEVDDQGVIRDLQVVGGCNGNLQGISALVKGMKGTSRCITPIIYSDFFHH